MKQCTVTFLVLVGMVSCNNPKFTDVERVEVTEAVRRTLAHYYSDIRSEGLLAEFKYLDRSPEFFWVPPGSSSALSYDSVAAIIKANANLYQSIDEVFDTLRISALTPELAVYTGKLRSAMKTKSGQILKLSLVEPGFMIKRTDGWKLLCGQTALLPHQ